MTSNNVLTYVIPTHSLYTLHYTHRPVTHYSLYCNAATVSLTSRSHVRDPSSSSCGSTNTANHTITHHHRPVNLHTKCTNLPAPKRDAIWWSSRMNEHDDNNNINVTRRTPTPESHSSSRAAAERGRRLATRQSTLRLRSNAQPNGSRVIKQFSFMKINRQTFVWLGCNDCICSCASHVLHSLCDVEHAPAIIWQGRRPTSQSRRRIQHKRCGFRLLSRRDTFLGRKTFGGSTHS